MAKTMKQTEPITECHQGLQSKTLAQQRLPLHDDRHIDDFNH
jgi:hypothetical protein